MGAGIAPIAIQIVGDLCGGGSGEVEKCVGCLQCGLGGKNFGGGDRDARLGCVRFCRVYLSSIDLTSGMFDERGGRLEAYCDFADLGDRQSILR